MTLLSQATGLSRDRAQARKEIGDATKELLRTYLTQTLKLNERQLVTVRAAPPCPVAAHTRPGRRDGA